MAPCCFFLSDSFSSHLTAVPTQGGYIESRQHNQIVVTMHMRVALDRLASGHANNMAMCQWCGRQRGNVQPFLHTKSWKSSTLPPIVIKPFNTAINYTPWFNILINRALWIIKPSSTIRNKIRYRYSPSYNTAFISKRKKNVLIRLK